MKGSLLSKMIYGAARCLSVTTQTKRLAYPLFPSEHNTVSRMVLIIVNLSLSIPLASHPRPRTRLRACVCVPAHDDYEFVVPVYLNSGRASAARGYRKAWPMAWAGPGPCGLGRAVPSSTASRTSQLEIRLTCIISCGSSDIALCGAGRGGTGRGAARRGPPCDLPNTKTISRQPYFSFIYIFCEPQRLVWPPIVHSSVSECAARVAVWRG